MWFDTQAKLAEIHGKPQPGPDLPDSAVEIPWNDPDEIPPEELAPGVAEVAIVAAPLPEMTPDELACDIFEERAAIREYDGGQDQAEAERDAWPEARRAAGITALDDWRREADDLHNPDNWR